MSVILNGQKVAGNLADYAGLTNLPTMNAVQVTGALTSYGAKILWTGTKDEYDAIAVKDANTLYCINDDSEPSSPVDAYTKAEVDGLISNMQTTNNRTTTWSTVVTDTKYPTEKLVKDSLDEMMQTFYDIIHPVGEEVIGFTAPVVPSTVEATWSDISSTYENRTLWISSSATAKSILGPSLPNIVGTATDSRYETGASVWNDYSGAIEKYETSTLTTKLTYGSNAYGMTGFKLNAHTYNPIYGGDAGDYVVRPNAVVIKVWKRTV